MPDSGRPRVRAPSLRAANCSTRTEPEPDQSEQEARGVAPRTDRLRGEGDRENMARHPLTPPNEGRASVAEEVCLQDATREQVRAAGPLRVPAPGLPRPHLQPPVCPLQQPAQGARALLSCRGSVRPWGVQRCCWRGRGLPLLQVHSFLCLSQGPLLRLQPAVPYACWAVNRSLVLTVFNASCFWMLGRVQILPRSRNESQAGFQF